MLGCASVAFSGLRLLATCSRIEITNRHIMKRRRVKLKELSGRF